MPCKALTNKLIHNSNVPSKHDFTVLSSTPSKGENVFITWSTRHNSFARFTSPNYSFAKIENSFSRTIGANLYNPVSQLLLICEVSRCRYRKNSIPASIDDSSSDYAHFMSSLKGSIHGSMPSISSIYRARRARAETVCRWECCVTTAESIADLTSWMKIWIRLEFMVAYLKRYGLRLDEVRWWY